MAESKIIKEKCPYCDSVALEVSRSTFLGDVFITLECGHTITKSKIKSQGYNITSTDGRQLYQFQKDGISFLEQAQGRALIADEMGLGKTVQALGFIKLHPEMLPAVIVVKSSLKLQWFGELIRWTGLIAQVISKGKTKVVPGFDVYIVTYDLLRRLDDDAKSSLKVKTIILDECQQIKNHLSQRAKQVQVLCKDVPNIIALSGTPIKNNAGEYFTVLNILKPERFSYYDRFIRDYCDSYDNGWVTKIGGIKNIDLFQQDTSDFIIRRTRAEVLPDLPKVSRNFHHVELDAKFEKMYKKAQDDFEDWYYSEKKSFEEMSIIEKITQLRHIVGFNKVESTVEFISDFLLDTEPTRKITIFTHHLDVTTILVNNLQKFLNDNLPHIKICRIAADMSSDARHESVEKFKNDNNVRVCIASTLAAGEGLNMQFCSDCIIMERQWNPANEEQVEGRFIRIGQESSKVNATYMIASGTIDEFFTELVEQKRAIVSAALDGQEIVWNQQSLLKELADMIAMRGGKRWRLT